jgi:hypothetical protein
MGLLIYGFKKQETKLISGIISVQYLNRKYSIIEPIELAPIYT